ncbi:uncharacterized protein MONOS_17566 [Monocercomonoides exilis]|uniref:uncharacterized protein n=1 Tax=Monocercomonoides exilis TaxID=2049356 RepID=UPI003559FC37|nr:hypothetical protein MONOS_17566 [Monocercomonoides exilis]
MKIFLFFVFCAFAEHQEFALRFSTGNDEDCRTDHSKPCKTFSGLFRILDGQSEVAIFPEKTKEVQHPSTLDKALEYVLFNQENDQSFIFTSPAETEPLLKLSNVKCIDFVLCLFSTSKSPILELSNVRTIKFEGCIFSGEGNEKGTGPLVKVVDTDYFCTFSKTKDDTTTMTSFEHHTIDGQGAGLYVEVAKKVEIHDSAFVDLIATQGGGLFAGKEVVEFSMEGCKVADTKATGEQDNGGGAGVYISSVSAELEAEEKAAKLKSCSFLNCDSGRGTGMERGFGGCVYTGRSIVCERCSMSGGHGRRGNCLSVNGRGIKAGQKCLVMDCEFRGEWRADAKDETVAEVLLHVLAFEELNVSGNSEGYSNFFEKQASSLTTAGIYCADVDKMFISKCKFENCFGCDGGCIAAEPVADWQSEMSVMEIVHCEMKGSEEEGRHSQKGEPKNSGAMVFAQKVKNVTISNGNSDKIASIWKHTSLANERSGGVVCENADVLSLSGVKLESLNGLCGGAIFVKQDVKLVELKSLTIAQCSAIYSDKDAQSGRGGAMFIADYAPKAFSSLIHSLTSSFSCHSSVNDAFTTVDIKSCHISNCSATEGGAIFVETCESDGAQRKKLLIDQTDFVSNKAKEEGGAIMIREKKNREPADKEKIHFTNSTALKMKKRAENEDNSLHLIQNSRFSHNECKAKASKSVWELFNAKASEWPVTPCGSAISIRGADEAAEAAEPSHSNEQAEYLLLSSSSEYVSNVHTAIYATKGAKVKSRNDSFSNNVERDKEDLEILVDISCENAEVSVTSPRNSHPQRLCDETCRKLSAAEESAVKCEFYPTRDIQPSYSSVLYATPLKLPSIEFKGRHLYPLNVPILWIGKSERTEENSKEGVSVELESKKESNATSQYVFRSKGEIDVSKLSVAAPSVLYLHVSVDEGESWSAGMKMSVERKKNGVPGYGIALIVVGCVLAVGAVIFVVVFCVVRRRKRGYKSITTK